MSKNYRFDIVCTTFNQDIDELFEFCCKEINLAQESKNDIHFSIVFEESEKLKCLLLKDLLIDKFDEEIFSCLINDIGQGFPSSLNYGIIKSKAEYIFRIDTDDQSINNRYDVQSKYMLSNDIDISYSYLLDKHTKRILKYPKNNFSEIYLGFGVSPMAHPSICIKKEIFYIIGFYEKTLKRCEDLDLWIRYLFKFGHRKISLINKPLVKYSTSNSIKKSKENAYHQIKIRISHIKKISIYLFLVSGTLTNLLRLIFPKFLLEIYRIFQSK